MSSGFLFMLSTVPLVCASHSEIISDIMTPVEDEGRALEIKSQQFWELIKTAAQETHIDQHIPVYAEVQASIDALPEENSHVREMMSEALLRLKRADEKVLQQACQSSDLAQEKLITGSAPQSTFSFMTGGQNFLSLAIKRFVGGGDYADQVSAQVAARQGDILPTLRGAAAITGNVLDDCRTASKLGFDVLKYDLYNKGVPKTPEPLKDAAYKLVEAVGQTRHHFMQGIIGIANALTKDTEEKHVNPSAKVTQTLMSDLQPFGAQEVNDDDGGTTITPDDTSKRSVSTEDEALVIDL